MIKRLLVMFLSLMMFGCEQSQDEKPNDLLVVRVPRKKIINSLIKDDINFYQQGQTITLIIPASKLFNRSTLNDVYRSQQVYKHVAKVINTYRVETLKIESNVLGSDSDFAKDFSSRRAQIVQENLVRHGAKAAVVLSRGNSRKEIKSYNTIDNGDYIKIEFRYLRIIV